MQSLKVQEIWPWNFYLKISIIWYWRSVSVTFLHNRIPLDLYFPDLWKKRAGAAESHLFPIVSSNYWQTPPKVPWSADWRVSRKRKQNTDVRQGLWGLPIRRVQPAPLCRALSGQRAKVKNTERTANQPGKQWGSRLDGKSMRKTKEVFQRQNTESALQCTGKKKEALWSAPENF